MPRKSRIDAPGALHHVIIRGIERSPIFRDGHDYEHFISRLARLIHETSTSCYAWALMNNHVHLLLRSGRFPLSTLMRRLLTGYAQYFNRRYSRSGHLFQNRYKSFLCEEDPYLLELVRYIHLNPVRARAVRDMAALERYPFCGHSVIMGRIKRDWQDASFVLSLFHENQSSARRAYVSFVEKGLALGKRPDLTGGGFIRSQGGWAAVHTSKERFASDERLLGSSDFVISVLKQAHEDHEKRIGSDIDLEDIITAVCDHLNIDQALLLIPTKQTYIARARAIISSVAFDSFRIQGVDIAKRLRLTPAAVSRLAPRGRSDPFLGEIKRALFGGQ